MALLLLSCSDPTAPIIPEPGPRRLFAGGYVTCTLRPGDELYCWGSNVNMEFSENTRSGFHSPEKLAVPRIVELGGGSGDHICGIDAIGAAYCWGRGNFGQVGNGRFELDNRPTRVSDLLFRNISTGQVTTCAVTTTDRGLCWGLNQRGELGDETADAGPLVGLQGTQRYSSPRLVSGGHAWKTIAPGWMHSCGIRTDGVAMCWGNNQNGEMGIGALDSTMHRVPEAVATSERFAQITAGWRQTCALTLDGRAYCWGLNAFGQLGDGTYERRVQPTPVIGNLRFRQIVTMNGASVEGASFGSEIQLSKSHTCALTLSGAAYCWGRNAFGQLGNGSTVDSPVPVPVPGLVFEEISVVSGRTCGRNAGDVWCWGHNDSGQLGFWDLVTPILTPRKVIFPSDP